MTREQQREHPAADVASLPMTGVTRNSTWTRMTTRSQPVNLERGRELDRAGVVRHDAVLPPPRSRVTGNTMTSRMKRTSHVVRSAGPQQRTGTPPPRRMTRGDADALQPRRQSPSMAQRRSRVDRVTTTATRCVRPSGCRRGEATSNGGDFW